MTDSSMTDRMYRAAVSAPPLVEPSRPLAAWAPPLVDPSRPPPGWSPPVAGGDVAAPNGPHGPQGWYAGAAKRVIDVVAATLVALLTLPILLTVWLAARVSSGAPGIFTQQRVGRHGQLFTVYKLRTMVDDPEGDRQRLQPNEDGRIVHKIAHDPRITRAGRFLRKWSLDELPQLWNVLRGDMSLVGPRPELPQIVAHYQPWQRRRHAVRPGMTGLWQVSARSDGLMHECVELDLEYLDRLSLRMDLKILALTPLAALGRRPGI